MSEVLKVSPKTISELLANEDSNILHALRNSVYPGAKDESIGMVLAYCKAKKYDPLAKAVHIVPMNVKNSISGRYEYRDVIMPGIAAYRIDAERSGAYVGLSRPEFGPVVTENLGGVEVSYPEWCRVMVKKMVQGTVCEFEAEEYWKENYANKGKDPVTKRPNLAPNEMWFKRSRGQLAKCTEAQALRKAFPGIITNVPTFEEMEGKDYSKSGPLTLVEIETNESINSEHLDELKKLISETSTDEMAICQFLKIDCLESMTVNSWIEVMRQLKRKSKKNKVEELEINKVFENKEETEEPTEQTSEGGGYDW